ncbi:phage/plasmid primase, P4 family [Bacillus sp. FSL W7-1360]
MAYDFNNIPDELQECPQWVLWRKETRGDKATKVPYRADGIHAKSNDPSDWMQFDRAVQSYNDGKYDGIGFMFTQNDPFIGVDIDHCIDGKSYSEMAQDIILSLDSYTERSPSGEGLHIIIKGELPERVKNTGAKNPEKGLEIYRHGRYFTFTGDAVHPTSVQERTDEIKAIFDAYIPDKRAGRRQRESSPQGDGFTALKSDSELLDEMFNGKNGAAIKKLWEGHFEGNDHSGADLSLCNHLACYTDRDTARMDALFRQSGLMRDKWDSARGDSTYGADTIQKAADECVITISEYKEQKRQERQAAQQQKSDAGAAQGAQEQPRFNLTELGNAERIKHYEGHRLKYCKGIGWLVWDGKKWANDEMERLDNIVSETLRKIYAEAHAEQDEDLKKEMLKWAKKSESLTTTDNSIERLRRKSPILKSKLDSHEMLFNCSNGVINLKTGELMPHDKELYLTQITDVEYNPHVECPTWLKFLNDIIVDKSGKTDADTINYLQKAFGYSLTGSTKEQCMFFLHGGGKNGKSTLVSTLRNVLGDYGRQSDAKTFIEQKNEGVRNDIAALDGSRFVAAVESKKGQQLDESLVKQLTGGDSIRTRFLYKESFEFTPDFKIFFTTNHKPIIKNDDEGIWRRVHLIPFNAHIPPEDRDPDLLDKLRAEAQGILNWLVQGAIKWQKEGLEKSEMVEQSTRFYREEMDILAPFLDEICIKHTEAKVEAKVLYSQYKDWCFKNDEDLQVTSSRNFYRMMEERGFKKDRGAKNKMFIFGTGLKKDYFKPVHGKKGATVALKSNPEKAESNPISNPDSTFISVELD